jgi:hypothetical protein
MKSLLLFFLCVVFSVGTVKMLDYLASDPEETGCYAFQFYSVPFTMLSLNVCTGEHEEIILSKFQLFSFTTTEPIGTSQ